MKIQTIKSKKRGAFTLIEMIVVLVILAILVVLVVPKVTSYVTTARETAAVQNARTVMNAVQLAIMDKTNAGEAMPTSLGNGSLDKYLEKANNKKLTYEIQLDKGQVTGGIVTTDGVSVRLPDLSLMASDPGGGKKDQ